MTNRPTMTKQHFIAIANTIFSLDISPETKERIAAQFANMGAHYNDHFDHDRFMLACTTGKISARKGTVPR